MMSAVIKKQKQILQGEEQKRKDGLSKEHKKEQDTQFYKQQSILSIVNIESFICEANAQRKFRFSENKITYNTKWNGCPNQLLLKINIL